VNIDTDELKIDAGTVNFWIKENQIQFNDSKVTSIFSVDSEGGSIFIIKDRDNKLKVFYVVIGKGRIDLESDVSYLSSQAKHMITCTWSLVGKKLGLYIDGKEVAVREISF
jgi:hypothetical protein